MTLPREVIPGRFYMITRRCTQRAFLLRPDAETNNAFLYCLADAALRCKIEVILTCAMSNHHHTIVYDRHGTLPSFTEHFHKFLAKCQNALRGRWENVWASEPVSIVNLVEPADVMRKLVYVATNPVKDNLVERVHHWPGVNGLSALLGERELRATRPRHFFRRDGAMPKALSLRLAIPAELGEAEQIRQELRSQVASIETAAAAERRRTGARVLGRREVLRQSWRDAPDSRARRSGLRPTVAACCQWRRIEALLRNRAFLDAYRIARKRWIAGEPSVFPAGTYWLRRFACVQILS